MKFQGILPWVIVLGLGFILFQVNNCYQRREGERDQRIEARDSVIAALARVKARVDTEYVKGRTVYLDANTEWEELKLTLTEKEKLDPVVLAGDKLAAACKSIVASCEDLRQVSDSIIAEQTFQIEDLKKGPGWFRRNFGCVGGVAGNQKGVGPGVACGFLFP